MRIELPMITAICFDGRAYDQSVAYRYRRIVDHMTSTLKFSSIRMLLTYDLAHPSVESIRIDKCGISRYNDWCLYDIISQFNTEFALVFQADGFALNAEAWTDKFLLYDYIGAPWPKYIPWNGIDRVGNGGFSLRSKALCRFTATLPRSTTNEDAKICIEDRNLVEQAGLKIASVDIARRFSVENPIDAEHNIKNVFGYHGVQHEKSIKELLGL